MSEEDVAGDDNSIDAVVGRGRSCLGGSSVGGAEWGGAEQGGA